MRRLVVIAVLLLTLVVAVAQRKVTPVASTDELKPVTKEELKEIRRQEKLKFLRTDALLLVLVPYPLQAETFLPDICQAGKSAEQRQRYHHPWR